MLLGLLHRYIDTNTIGGETRVIRLRWIIFRRRSLEFAYFSLRLFAIATIIVLLFAFSRAPLALTDFAVCNNSNQPA